VSDPTSEEQAAAALRASKPMHQGQQALAEESRVLLTSFIRAELRDELRMAVADGITAAMTDEAAERFWSKGLEVLQRQAKQKAGGFLLDGLAAAAKKLLWVAVFVVIAYSVGGWALMKAVWAALTKG
jgi:hypothetical protein